MFLTLDRRELDWTLVPALLQATRVDLRSAQTGGRTIAGRKRFLSLGALVGGQVALTVPLLFGAGGFFLHTFLHLWNMNPGFDADHVLTARFSMKDARYDTPAAMSRLYDRALIRLHETQGIEAAAVALTLPYERALNDNVKVAGLERKVITNVAYITPEYFTALRIPLLRGRVFSAADGVESEKVAIVNEAFVKRYYLKDGEVLGRPLNSGVIVGVVGDVLVAQSGWGNFGPVAAVPEVFIPATCAKRTEHVAQLVRPELDRT